MNDEGVGEELVEAIRNLLNEMPDGLPCNIENRPKHRLSNAFERWRCELLRNLGPAALEQPEAPRPVSGPR